MQAIRERPPRDRMDPRARQVIDAAAILEISEYELLDMAYREWFGRPPSARELNEVFGPYMFDGVTPYWAASLARQVIALHDEGRLEQSRFRPAARPPPSLRDILTAIAQSVLLLLLFWLIYHLASTYHPPG